MRSPGLTKFARKIDIFLFDYLKLKEAELAEIDPASSTVLSPIARLLQRGGKRVRPYLCVLGYEAAGGLETEAILRAAASLELFHTFAILHDDVIDASSIRRGAPSAHAAISDGGSDLQGLAAAILAGDLAFSLSDELLWTSGFPAEELAAASARVARMRLETAAGQAMEVAFHPSGRSIPEPWFATKVSLMKTASYSTTGPLVIGATLARADDQFLRLLEEAGNAIGEALQLADDLDELEREGGGLLDDLRNGRAPMILLEAAKDEGVAERVLPFWGNPRLTQDESDEVAALLRGSPARERVRNRLNDLCEEAASLFQSIPGRPGESLREFAVSLRPSG